MTVGSDDLASLARAWGLPATAACLASLEGTGLGVDAPETGGPPEVRGARGTHEEPLALLGQMVRRGLDPVLVRRLLPFWGDRPLELGLFAWDVLTGALLPDDDEALLDALRAAAVAVRAVLPSPGHRGADTVSGASLELVERVALPPLAAAGAPASLDRLVDGLERAELGAYEALRRRGRRHAELLLRSDALEAARRFALVCHRAHLPTLASFYLDYLWRAFAWTPALDDLCEVLLDAGAADRLPSPTPSREDRAARDGGRPLRDADPPPRECRASCQALVEYVTYRAGIVGGDPGWAYGLLKASQCLGISKLAPHPDGPGAEEDHDPRLDLVHAELAARIGEAAVPWEVVDRIARERPDWRYAMRVRTLVANALGGPGAKDTRAPLTLVDEYVSRFGNDARLWCDLIEQTPGGAVGIGDLLGRLAREAFHLPHEQAAWSALAAASGAGAAFAEIEARLAAQSTLH